MAGLSKPGIYKAGSELLLKDIHSQARTPDKGIGSTKSSLNTQCTSLWQCLGDVMRTADPEL